MKIEQIEKLLDKKLELLEKYTEDFIKVFPEDQKRILIESDIKRQAITEFFNDLKRLNNE